MSAALFFTSKEERFWKWFRKHSDELHNFQANQDAVFNMLSEALNNVQQGLTFEFGPVINGRREFIVSADGIRERFPAVQKLVAAAPSFENWTIIPFRPPKDLDLKLQFDGLTLCADDVWFNYTPEAGRISLRLYLRGLEESKKQSFAGAALILLDSALGEYAVETEVGALDFFPLPENPQSHGLKPFAALRSVFQGKVQ